MSFDPAMQTGTVHAELIGLDCRVWSRKDSTVDSQTCLQGDQPCGFQLLGISLKAFSGIQAIMCDVAASTLQTL